MICPVIVAVAYRLGHKAIDGLAFSVRIPCKRSPHGNSVILPERGALSMMLAGVLFILGC